MLRTLAVSTVLLVSCIVAQDRSSVAAEPQGPRVAGTMSCITDPAASLVFGRTPVGRCSFAPADGSARHAYMAMFETVHPGSPMPGAETLAWDVLARDGRLPRGALGGEFMVAGREMARMGDGASGAVLVPATQGAMRAATFVAIEPRVVHVSGR